MRSGFPRISWLLLGLADVHSSSVFRTVSPSRPYSEARTTTHRARASLARHRHQQLRADTAGADEDHARLTGERRVGRVHGVPIFVFDLILIVPSFIPSSSSPLSSSYASLTFFSQFPYRPYSPRRGRRRRRPVLAHAFLANIVVNAYVIIIHVFSTLVVWSLVTGVVGAFATDLVIVVVVVLLVAVVDVLVDELRRSRVLVLVPRRRVPVARPRRFYYFLLTLLSFFTSIQSPPFLSAFTFSFRFLKSASPVCFPV